MNCLKLLECDYENVWEIPRNISRKNNDNWLKHLHLLLRFYDDRNISLIDNARELLHKDFRRCVVLEALKVARRVEAGCALLHFDFSSNLSLSLLNISNLFHALTQNIYCVVQVEFIAMGAPTFYALDGRYFLSLKDDPCNGVTW